MADLDIPRYERERRLKRASNAYTDAMFGPDVHPVLFDRRLVLAAMSRQDGEKWLARQRRTNDPRIRALAQKRHTGAA